MRVGNGLQLASISASWTKKEFKLRTVYSRISQQKKPVRVYYESSNLSPSLSTCRLFGNHSLWQFKKTIEGFDCKINGLALGAALLHSLGWPDGRALPSTKTGRFQVCCSGSATTGSLEEKSASTLAILTPFES